MRSLASMTSCTAANTSLSLLLAILLLIPVSQASYGPNGRPQLLHAERRAVEERSYVDSLGSLFGKRDDCTTQFGAGYLDCGYNGCFQPGLGQVCCGASGYYCPSGQFCVGNNCCPNGLTGACCIQGEGCPANVSSYFTSSLSTAPPAAATTSQPLPISTSVEAATTTSPDTSTSVAAVVTTPLMTSTAPITVESTSSVVSVPGTTSDLGGLTGITSNVPTSTQSGGGLSTFVSGSGAQQTGLRVGVEGVVVGVLGVVGFVAGLL